MKRKPEGPAPRRGEARVALVLCAAVLAAGALALSAAGRPSYAAHFAPGWLPLAAAGVAAAGLLVLLTGRPRSPRLRRALSWGGLLLLWWTASGVLIDLLRIAGGSSGLMPPEVDWPGFATRALALAAAVVLARLVLAAPAGRAPTGEAPIGRAPAGEAPADQALAGEAASGCSGASRAAGWYGYAAFALALPYPLVKTCWALGGSLGLLWPGAAGHVNDAGALERFGLWLPALPWILAAVLSLLLVPVWRRVPRRPLLAAGWFATVVAAMVGPAACWSLITAFSGGIAPGASEGIATWVFWLFYGSWMLWAIAAGVATRSYQLRSAPSR